VEGTVEEEKYKKEEFLYNKEYDEENKLKIISKIDNNLFSFI
jgi:hypothetical protein